MEPKTKRIKLDDDAIASSTSESTKKESTPSNTFFNSNKPGLGYVVVMCDDTHTSRIAEYIPEVYPEASVAATLPSLVWLEHPNPHSFLLELFKHDMLYRYVHRYYTITKKVPTLDVSSFDIADLTLRVQIFPKGRSDQILDTLEENGVKLHPKEFSHYLSIICVDDGYYMGLAPKEVFFCVENAIHSVKKHRLSRAYYKLKETIERVHLELKPEWVAIDVGASPGGWSEYLSGKVSFVVAVDPGKLKIAPNDKIRHIQKRAQFALDEIGEYKYDLMVVDINNDPKEMLDNVFSTLHTFMNSGGYVILTLKWPKRHPTIITAKTDSLIQDFVKRFTDFEVIRKLWCLANSNERCLVCRKK